MVVSSDCLSSITVLISGEPTPDVREMRTPFPPGHPPMDLWPIESVAASDGVRDGVWLFIVVAPAMIAMSADTNRGLIMEQAAWVFGRPRPRFHPGIRSC
jgi:hypothetical protein